MLHQTKQMLRRKAHMLRRTAQMLHRTTQMQRRTALMLHRTTRMLHPMAHSAMVEKKAVGSDKHIIKYIPLSLLLLLDVIRCNRHM